MKIYKSQLLILTTLLIIGCARTQEPKKTPATVKNKPVTQQKESYLTVNDLKSAGFGTVKIKGKKVYSQNKPIQFIIDTEGKTGYLYIVYLDNKGNTTLLYPNSKSPLTELNGKYLFPRDFGGMKITATKDCKGCEKEITTVYAILSKKPISDIQNLKAKHLIQGKGLSMSLPGSSPKNSNINIGKIQFFVK